MEWNLEILRDRYREKKEKKFHRRYQREPSAYVCHHIISIYIHFLGHAMVRYQENVMLCCAVFHFYLLILSHFRIRGILEIKFRENMHTRRFFLYKKWNKMLQKERKVIKEIMNSRRKQIQSRENWCRNSKC